MGREQSGGLFAHDPFELYRLGRITNPNLVVLGQIGRGHFGVLQYWRSFEHLEAWSHKPPHSEWWRDIVARMRTRGDVGVYHETFLVPRDRIESIYLECAPAGLSVFGTPGEPNGPATTSRGRLGGIRAPGA